uniref:Uncharacterized protein n=1 Tax=Anguilla anguilla TaxID=7936 RepID=A0A0E9R9Y4_ANGAN
MSVVTQGNRFVLFKVRLVTHGGSHIEKNLSRFFKT